MKKKFFLNLLSVFAATFCNAPLENLQNNTIQNSHTICLKKLDRAFKAMEIDWLGIKDEVGAKYYNESCSFDLNFVEVANLCRFLLSDFERDSWKKNEIKSVLFEMKKNNQELLGMLFEVSRSGISFERELFKNAIKSLIEIISMSVVLMSEISNYNGKKL